MKKSLLVLLLCACPPVVTTGPDASVDAGPGDSGTVVDAGPGVSVIAPIAAPLRLRTELDRSIETRLVSLGDRALVVSSSDDPGCYLWGTNGTAATTEVLAKLSSDGQRCTQSSATINFAPVVAKGEAYFLWGDSTATPSGPLWRSDGTKAGTRKLAAPANPLQLFGLDDRVVMVIEVSGAWGLWQYLPATDQFEKLTALSAQPFFRGHAQLGGTHYFSLGLAGRWQTDLTPSGTVPAGPMVDLIGEGVPLGTQVVVHGNGPQGTGVYVADGTDAGTVLVAPGGNDAGRYVTYSELRRIGARAVFARITGPFGTTIADRTDLLALEAGQTAPVSLGPPAETFTWWIAERDGGAWYAARRDGGEDLYFTDGISASTRVAALPHDTIAGAALDGRFLIQNIATFTYPGRTYDVWSTGAADGGLARLLNTGSPGAFALTDAGVVLWEGTSLFATDFTWKGTTPYRTLWSQTPVAMFPLITRGFACTQVTERLEPSLWCTDGTAAGTQQVAVLSDPTGSTTMGADRFALIERDAVLVTDGTPAGTRRYPAGPGLSHVIRLDAQHAFVWTGGAPFVLDLATGAQTPFPQLVQFPGQVALLGGGRLAMIDALDAVKVVDATGAVSTLGPTGGTLESDGTRGWLIERAPQDGGSPGVWAIDATAVRVGAIRSPWFLLAHRGDLYALSPTAGQPPAEVVVTRFSTTAAPREVTRVPYAPLAYTYSLSAVGGLVALHLGDTLMLHDPAVNRTWAPFPSLGRAELPRFVAGDAGFPVITADGGVLFYDLAREALRRPEGPAASGPTGLAGVGERTVLWAHDPLGWAPWVVR